VQGCGTFEPVAQRTYSEDGQATNRRVEIEATPTLVEELQDRPATTATPVGELTRPAAPAASQMTSQDAAAPVKTIGAAP
jgi:hypothetical protein